MKINKYFSDQVISLSFNNANGKSSIGVMSTGSYQFSTTQDESMLVISGALLVQRQEDPEPILFSDGDKFNVSKNQNFTVDVSEQTAYLCEYS